jgi:hypothetical protein
MRLSVAHAASRPGEDLGSWLERADAGLLQNQDAAAVRSTR